MAHKDIIADTQREWRELGFYYDRDDDSFEWQIIASRAGLLRFTEIVKAYATSANPDDAEGYIEIGPYSYLKLGSAPDAEITDDWIAGPGADFINLADNIDKLAASATPGSSFSLRPSFAPDEPYDLICHLRADDFDPASADPVCQAAS